jgi:two-component system sensor histidine kinase RegB
MADDARAIRERVERCREIIGQLSSDAGQSPGEGAARVTSEEILQLALAGLGDPGRVRVDADGESGVRRLEVPLRATAQALRNVLKNALDASPDDSIVVMRMRCAGDTARFEVEDEGSGMPADIVARCTEPFFTTKEPGSGMGLGLFLTRSVVDQLGGTLSVKSQPGVGTTVVLSLPWQGAAMGRIADVRAS